MEKQDIIIFTLYILAVLACLFFGFICTCNDFGKRPTAIDVYRGKTTLEITYRDSVAVDSVVVYKKFDYGK